MTIETTFPRVTSSTDEKNNVYDKYWYEDNGFDDVSDDFETEPQTDLVRLSFAAMSYRLTCIKEDLLFDPMASGVVQIIDQRVQKISTGAPTSSEEIFSLVLMVGHLTDYLRDGDKEHITYCIKSM